MKTKNTFYGVLLCCTILFASCGGYDAEKASNEYCECFDKTYPNMIEKEKAMYENNNDETKKAAETAKAEFEECKKKHREISTELKGNGQELLKYVKKMNECERETRKKLIAE
ncbi:MAG TPA: hypothetical protein VD905_18410 [Flavobacteriales bacterium]|nr:hypothetical protein [Flavobacteriales bacterium]